MSLFKNIKNAIFHCVYTCSDHIRDFARKMLVSPLDSWSLVHLLGNRDGVEVGLLREPQEYGFAPDCAVYIVEIKYE